MTMKSADSNPNSDPNTHSATNGDAESDLVADPLSAPIADPLSDVGPATLPQSGQSIERRAQAEAERRSPEQPLAPSSYDQGSSRQDWSASYPGRSMMPNDFPGGQSARMGYPSTPTSPPAPPSSPFPAYPPYPPYPEQPQAYPRYPPYAERRRGTTPTWVKLLGGCLSAMALLLILLTCAAGGLALAYFGAFGGYDTPATAASTQTFHVTGTPTLHITSPAGNIEVLRGEAATVTVEATKYARARSRVDAQDTLRQIIVGMTQSGNTLNVQVSLPGSTGFGFLIGNRHVDLTVTVPEQTNLTATLNAGDVQVHDITGTVTIHNDAGNLTLDAVRLVGASTLGDHAGNIEVTGALNAGASLEARTNAGNVRVTLPESTAAHLDARTQAGNVDVDSVWPITVSRHVSSATASGDLQPNPSGHLTLTTDAGNITVAAG